MRAYGGFLLFLRSGLLTAVMLALSAGAHVTGGGVLPHAGVLACLAAVALVPVTAIALRRVRLRTAVLALGLGQGALHVAFIALAAGSCGTGIPDETLDGAHAGHATSAAATPAQHCIGAASHLVTGLMDGNGMMTAAHAAAVMATAAVVAGGERSLVLLLAWLTPFLLPLPVPAVPAAGERLRTRSDVVCPVLPRRNLPIHGRRGPPVLGLATA